ncbi:hypothetical protein [Nocardia noduli]|uniref:hypothetical protein n=1 Tax=Nocardia noduli TaxID=2815722 RepID=UPI001C212399|nr:hypothetical protein [Nocardia noduli]
MRLAIRSPVAAAALSATLTTVTPAFAEVFAPLPVAQHTDVTDARPVAEGGTGSGQFDIVSTLIGLLVAGTPGYCPIVAGSSFCPR